MEIKELSERYGINLRKLEEEQEKLFKSLELKDKIDFSLADRFGGVKNSMFGKQMISAIIVCDKNFEIIDQVYFIDKVKFPYIPGFIAYRDLPVMMGAFNKLEEKPDVIFVLGNGITHQRLGIASHFSLSTGVPSIGIVDSLVKGECKGEDVIFEKNKIARVLVTKSGSRPMYISPGNNITLESAYQLSKNLINLPHKYPEPLTLANKYMKRIIKELNT